MDPQQELFTELLIELKETGYDVYDGDLPPDGTPYPFYYLGENMNDDTYTKNGVVGELTQTVHIYHDRPYERGTVSNMIWAAKMVAGSIQRSHGHSFSLIRTHQEILPDNTTPIPLVHAPVDLTFKYS